MEIKTTVIEISMNKFPFEFIFSLENSEHCYSYYLNFMILPF